jgi:hypothetical protein
MGELGRYTGLLIMRLLGCFTQANLSLVGSV